MTSIINIWFFVLFNNRYTHLTRAKKENNDVFNCSWAIPNELELYAKNLVNILHSFILGLFSKFGGDLKHLHEYKEGLGKIGDTLFTTMKIIEKYNILPHDDGDSMFSYIIWFFNCECFKPYLIISQVSVMLIMD
jgi:hypothetical protein